MGIDLPPDEIEKLGLKPKRKRKASNPSKLAKVPESQVVKECLKLLRKRNWCAWRNNTGATKVDKRFLRYGIKGSSDIVGVVPASGRFMACENKRPYIKGVQAAGKLSDDQRVFLKTVHESGGVSVVIDDPAALGIVMDALEIDPWATIPLYDEVIEL